jgi:DNA primase
VRSLYQAEFNQRFEANFMARPHHAASRPWGQPRKPGQRWQVPIPGASAALKAQVAQWRDPVLGPLLCGLLLRPALADAHGDALAMVQPGDGEEATLLAAVLELVAAMPGLAAGDLSTHLYARGLGAGAERLRRNAGLALSFTRADAPENVARADFAMVLAQATARAGLVQALAEATVRFGNSLSDEDYAAQQALREEIAALDAAMMTLAESRREG